jgi:hypothetical protein
MKHYCIHRSAHHSDVSVVQVSIPLYARHTPQTGRHNLALSWGCSCVPFYRKNTQPIGQYSAQTATWKQELWDGTRREIGRSTGVLCALTACGSQTWDDDYFLSTSSQASASISYSTPSFLSSVLRCFGAIGSFRYPSLTSFNYILYIITVFLVYVVLQFLFPLVIPSYLSPVSFILINNSLVIVLHRTS